jgi:branched-chain amino acid transport system permease protein
VTLTLLLEPVLRGLSAGALYGLVAMGLTMIFGVMRVINVAHGELVMLGGYGAYFLWTLLHVDPLAGLVIVIPAAILFGIFIHLTLVERVASQAEISSLMVTFGLSIVLWSLAQIAFTANFRSIRYLGQAVRILGVYLPANAVVIFAVSVALSLLTSGVLARTLLGRAIRATSQNEALAQACGINCRMVRAVGFGIGTALAAAGGVLVAVAFVIYPQVGLSYIGKAFAVAVLGGMGNVSGALAGGIILGIVESIGAQIFTAQISQVFAWALIFLMLILRPTGLFGAAE